MIHNDPHIKRHIEVYHEKNGHYRTAIPANEPLQIAENWTIPAEKLYHVVTRVNYNTTLLWLEWRNKIAKSKPELKLEQIQKPDWLIRSKWYRRAQEEVLKQ